MKREAGFTLVEVLVVMVIMGVLAAVAIPAYLHQRDKARDADARADARTAQTAAEIIQTENAGEYDGPQGVSVENLRALESTLNGADLSVPAVSEDSYTVRVGSPTGNHFDITRNPDGGTDRECETAGSGGCPSDGTWD